MRELTAEPPSESASVASRYSVGSVRRNAIYFAIAKLTSAGLGFPILVLVTSNLLPVEFGLYVLVTNFARLLIGLSLLGLDWVVFRYLPELYTSGSATSVRRLMGTCIALRSAVLGVLCLILLLAAAPVCALLGAPDAAGSLRLYLVIFVADGIAEFVRSNVFAALLRQGYQLVSQILRSAVYLVILSALVLLGTSPLTLRGVIVSEICGSTLGLLLVIAQLAALDRRHAREMAGREGHVTRGLRDLVRFGLSQYLNDLIRLLGDAPLVSIAGAHLVGLNSLASFGFARNLSLQIQRFLPSENFISLIWPKIIVSYSVSRSFDGLVRQSSLVMKLSNTALAAILCVFVVYGRFIVDLVSGGKYGHSYALLLVFQLWLFVQSQRILVDAIATTVERLQALRLGAAAMAVVTVPVVVLLAWLDLGALALAIGLVVGLGTSVGVAWWRLWRFGIRMAFDVRGHMRIAAAAAGAIAFGMILRSALPPGLVGLAIGGSAIGLAFAGGIRLLRPFGAEERESIERFVGRSLFIL
jgi:O-antigen/teichoic acid export membrane protein